MSALGYTDVAVLEGGIAAWEAAGYRLYSGVHVPSKAFAEVVEHEAGTPWISAPDLKALIDRDADIAIFDSTPSGLVTTILHRKILHAFQWTHMRRLYLLHHVGRARRG